MKISFTQLRQFFLASPFHSNLDDFHGVFHWKVSVSKCVWWLPYVICHVLALRPKGSVTLGGRD